MILVTGGTGLVGAHLLLELLQKGMEVMAVKRPSSNLNKVKSIFSYYTENPESYFSKIQWVDVDLLSLPSVVEACAGMEHVYHCAAFISFNPSDKRTMLINNIAGTANIVDACLTTDVKKLCHVSSVAALGEPSEDEDITEKTLWKSGKGRSTYAISKFKSEMEVWRGTCEGLNAIIVNPSVILGPGNWQSGSASIVENIYKGLKFYPPGKTGFVDVRDVVNAMVILMDSENVNERYILNAENVFYKDVFTRIAKKLDKPEPGIRVNSFIAGLAWRTAWLASKISGSKPAITKETADAGFNLKTYANNKVKDTMNLKFRGLDDTIDFVVRMYLSDKHKKK
jgi:dihydroflavonol-4-reductase